VVQKYSLFWGITQRRWAINRRRRQTTHRSQLQELISARRTCCVETSSLTNHQYRLSNIPEDRRPHLYRGGSLKSRICFFYQILTKTVTNTHKSVRHTNMYNSVSALLEFNELQDLTQTVRPDPYSEANRAQAVCPSPLHEGGWRSGGLTPLVPNFGTRWFWAVRPLCSTQNRTWYAFRTRLRGLWSLWARFVSKKRSAVQSVGSRYVYYAILACLQFFQRVRCNKIK
jgi:hypothetical protein